MTGRYPCPRRSAVLALLIALVAAAGPTEAAADPLSASAANRRLDEVDLEVRAVRAELSMVSSGYEAPLRREASGLEQRLREAEVQRLLGDPFRAAILLFDVAERSELATDPQYPQALLLLAESLLETGNLASAQRYFRQLTRTARGEPLARAVLGLLEVASRTGEFADVREPIERLSREGAVTDRPRVDYAHGKALFRAASTDVTLLSAALDRFRAVPPKQSVSGPAAYYEGVTLVRMGQLDQAVAAFSRATELASSHPDASRVRELASLSLGRIHQERGDVSSALDAYQAVSRDSPYFPDTLYEVAWVHVKAAERAEDEDAQRAALQRALDTLELITDVEADARVYPDARVLQGNLQIRLASLETAYQTFGDVVERFGAARDEMAALLAARGDSRAFFERLIRSDSGDLGDDRLLPPAVVRFALDDPGVARAVSMRKDLEEAERDISTSRELLGTLETALRSEQRFSMFPGVREARVRALSVQNRLLDAERVLIEVERRLAAPFIAPEAAAQWEDSERRVQAIEDEIRALPRTASEVEQSRDSLKADYEKVSHRVFRMLSSVRGLRSQVNAVRLWARREGHLSTDASVATEQRMASATAELTELERLLEAAEREVSRASLLSRGDGGWARAERLRQSMREALADLSGLLGPARARLGGEQRAALARLDQQRGEIRKVEQDLFALQVRLERMVDARVDEQRKLVLDVLRDLDRDARELGDLRRMSGELLGPVAEATVAAVGRELDQVVLEADVGILDVAWAKKRSHTDQVTELVRELNRRSGELQEEFREVLEDEP